MSHAIESTLRFEVLRGKSVTRPRAAARTVAPIFLPPLVLGLLVAGRGSWADAVGATAALLVVPGLCLLRALRVPAAVVRRNPIFVPASSLLVLVAVGLCVDLVGPHLGQSAPLGSRPLAMGVIGAVLLLGIVSAAAPADVLGWSDLALPVRHYWPLLLPLVAAIGAARLNHGASAAIAAVAATAALAFLVIGLVGGSRLADSHLSMLLFAVGLALLWSFSLRGQLVYGFDISSEFHLLSTTSANGIWHVDHRNDAYGAMLSLTVLPVVLHALGGLSDLLVLKVLYPVLFALVPVAVFSVARRFVAARWAFVAACLVLTQSYFASQLPAVARQEIGLLAFVAMLGALLETGMSRWRRLALVGGFGALLVVSHYTTTYIAAGMLAVSAVVLFIRSAFRRRWLVDGAVVVGLVMTAGGAVGWYGLVTHSTANVSQFTTDVRTKGFDFLPTRGANSSLLGTYLNGNSQTSVSPTQYQTLAEQNYAKDSWLIPLPAAAEPRYDLQAATPVAQPAQHVAVLNGFNTIEQGVGLAIEVFAVIAAIAIVLRRRERMVRLVGLLGLSTLGILVAVRLSGTVAESYNQSRVFLQALIPLSIGAAVLLDMIAIRRRWTSALVGLAAVVAVVVVGVRATGMYTFVGGDRPGNLSATSEDQERFVESKSDASGALWLNAAATPGAPIFADRYGALRILEATGRSQGVFQDLVPRVIDQHGWVYGYTANRDGGRARGVLGSDSATYAFPFEFLHAQFDKVYDDGTSAVWHR